MTGRLSGKSESERVHVRVRRSGRSCRSSQDRCDGTVAIYLFLQITSDLHMSSLFIINDECSATFSHSGSSLSTI